jgi:hypothetical protein
MSIPISTSASHAALSRPRRHVGLRRGWPATPAVISQVASTHACNCSRGPWPPIPPSTHAAVCYEPSRFCAARRRRRNRSERSRVQQPSSGNIHKVLQLAAFATRPRKPAARPSVDAMFPAAISGAVTPPQYRGFTEAQAMELLRLAARSPPENSAVPWAWRAQNRERRLDHE